MRVVWFARTPQVALLRRRTCSAKLFRPCSSSFSIGRGGKLHEASQMGAPFCPSSESPARIGEVNTGTSRTSTRQDCLDCGRVVAMACSEHHQPDDSQKIG